MSEKRLIVGLGNPGKKYEYTRHNVGFLVLQNLIDKFSLKPKPSSLTNGWIADGQIEGLSVQLLLPMTMMNNSGVAVNKIVTEEAIELNNILVVTDDVHLDFGQIRVRPKGSDGGHNGLGSIIYHLQSEQFSRLRFGVGKLPAKEAMVDYVLDEFNQKEKKELDAFIDSAAQCCIVWLKEGVERAMEQFNRTPKEEK